MTKDEQNLQEASINQAYDAMEEAIQTYIRLCNESSDIVVTDWMIGAAFVETKQGKFRYAYTNSDGAPHALDGLGERIKNYAEDNFGFYSEEDVDE